MFKFNKNKVNNKIKTINVSEVAHTIFYAPFYVSIENGYFKDEGININLTLTPGAPQVSNSVLSGDADIGFSGSEATIYVYKNKERDYLRSFARLTNKDGSFIITRKNYKNFSIKDLKNKKIVGGRSGGMPEMTLYYVLKKNNVNANIDTSVDFSNMAASFISGNGDAVTLFEPTASDIVKRGYGYKVESLGKLSGDVPYTAFYARRSFINKNKELINKFKRAINKGIKYTYSHSDMEVAEIIKNQFKETDIKTIRDVVKSYRNIKAWPLDSKFKKEDFNRMQDIMKYSDNLNKKVSYKKLVYEK